MDNKTSLGYQFALQSREQISLSFIAIDFLLFASGAIAHLGIPIPLGFTIWNETYLAPWHWGPHLPVWSRNGMVAPFDLVGSMVLLCGRLMRHDTSGNWLDPSGSHDEQRLPPYCNDPGDDASAGTTYIAERLTGFASLVLTRQRKDYSCTLITISRYKNKKSFRQILLSMPSTRL